MQTGVVGWGLFTPTGAARLKLKHSCPSTTESSLMLIMAHRMVCRVEKVKNPDTPV